VGVKGSRTRHLAGELTGVRSLPHIFLGLIKGVRNSSDGSEAVEIEMGLLGLQWDQLAGSSRGRRRTMLSGFSGDNSISRHRPLA
jgi:hypothetical protein